MAAREGGVEERGVGSREGRMVAGETAVGERVEEGERAQVTRAALSAVWLAVRMGAVWLAVSGCATRCGSRMGRSCI